ncbi:Type IV pilus assembly protein PilZ [gamma proteobacterium HTCC5015]|nr:Type IV pilus assembly protein PilZ [gamma proteobacterium HTCC5015]
MRTYTRYATQMPVELTLDTMEIEEETLVGIGYGGMQIVSDIPLSKGSKVNFRFPEVDPNYSAIGEVRWCHKASDHYDVGVEFTHRDEDLTQSLVEQIYYIESMRNSATRQGQVLSVGEAAERWRNDSGLNHH